MEEKKKTVLSADMELTDDELDGVAGGRGDSSDMCKCGRGKIVKNGLCRHCLEGLSNK